MTIFTPLWMQAKVGDTAVEYSGFNLRLGLTGTWASEGVVNNTWQVTQRGAGANFSVDVGGGVAVVTGNDIALQGAYLVVSDATENLVIPAPPGAGTRLHEIALHVKDALYDGTLPDNTYEAELIVLEDTGGGAAAAPASAIRIAQVSVAAGQASVTDGDITDIRISALTSPSWLRQVADATERPRVPLEGERIYRTDLDCMEISDGSSWFEIPRRDGGGSEWSTYTPSLTATTSNPTLGTGSTASGRYIRMGRTVTARVTIVFGTSGTGAGSGFYEISLPVAARTTTPGRQAVGSAYVRNNPENDFDDGIAFIEPSVGSRCRISIDSNVITHNVPWTWGVNDEIGFTVTYEAAS